jgi:magnesium-protoporphyrin O-methyltransferase
VTSSCCDFTVAAQRRFTGATAAKQLRRYRRGRLHPTTRLLRDGVVAAGLNSGVLLDIGSGVGGLTFELLDRGFSSAVMVEASSAFLAAGEDEAARLGRTASIRFVLGDFLRVSSELPQAAVVTLDRVVCCYPLYAELLERALRHAACGFAYSYPTERWYVRALVRLENARRVRKHRFRMFVHPVGQMDEIIERAGFCLVRRWRTMRWTADVYSRVGLRVGINAPARAASTLRSN